MIEKCVYLLIAITFFIAGSAYSLPVLDQEYNPDYKQYFQPYSFVGQTFTVGKTGQLTQVDLFLNTLDGSTGGFEIFPVDINGNPIIPFDYSTRPIGTFSLAYFGFDSSTVLFETISPYLGWASADLTGFNLNVVSGERYFIAGTLPSNVDWVHNLFGDGGSFEPYLDGTAFEAGLSGWPWVEDPFRDYLFRTYVDPAPVPEPSTFLLLGGGLAGLVFVARRRKKE